MTPLNDRFSGFSNSKNDSFTCWWYRKGHIITITNKVHTLVVINVFMAKSRFERKLDKKHKFSSKSLS